MQDTDSRSASADDDRSAPDDHDDDMNSDLDSSNQEFARVNRVMLSKKSEEYRQRRERNNAAVKKSRFKSKQKTLETQRRVEQLKEENAILERRLESLSREFNLMRDIFVPRRQQLQSQHQLQQQQLQNFQHLQHQQQQQDPDAQQRQHI